MKNNLYQAVRVNRRNKCDPYSSSITSLLVAPRDFRARVAVRTIVNCIKLHDQIDRVKNTRIGSSAIFLSLNESKNSIMSAAVPAREFVISSRRKAIKLTYLM